MQLMRKRTDFFDVHLHRSMVDSSIVLAPHRTAIITTDRAPDAWALDVNGLQTQTRRPARHAVICPLPNLAASFYSILSAEPQLGLPIQGARE